MYTKPIKANKKSQWDLHRDISVIGSMTWTLEISSYQVACMKFAAGCGGLRCVAFGWVWLRLAWQAMIRARDTRPQALSHTATRRHTCTAPTAKSRYYIQHFGMNGWKKWCVCVGVCVCVCV